MEEVLTKTIETEATGSGSDPREVGRAIRLFTARMTDREGISYILSGHSQEELDQKVRETRC